MNSQATRHARRVYVGGLPPTANEQVFHRHLFLLMFLSDCITILYDNDLRLHFPLQSVATFFSHVMSAIGGNSSGPGGTIVCCRKHI